MEEYDISIEMICNSDSVGITADKGNSVICPFAAKRFMFITL